VIDQDALGLDRVYIQAKRYAIGNNIGSGAIRDFFGSLDRHKATKGLFVTTSAFSSSATETAQLLSKRIVLIDGEQFASLPTIRKVLEGVEARTIERINNAQINNVFVAADRFAEFVGKLNKAST
jgi:restriction endonuclease Mrr